MTNPNCRHQNIHWEDLFKEPKKNKAYCLDCQADKGRTFSSACQLWYQNKVRKWLKDNIQDNNLISHHFENFLKKNNYIEHWNKLGTGKIDEEYFESSLFGQAMLFEVARSIESFCYEFKKEKDQPNDRERERERAKNNAYNNALKS